MAKNNSPFTTHHSQFSSIGKKERITQNRVIKLFQDELDYAYLGHWEVREENSNIEEEILSAYLTRKGYSPNLISKTRLKIRPVNILRSVRDSVYIDKGLSDGELVIKSPLSGAVDGMKVRINATIQPQIHTDPPATARHERAGERR